MRWQGRRESDNVEDRRSSGGGGPSMGGPGFRLPSGKGGIILLVVVLAALKNRPANQTVIVTGRGCHRDILELADTVSELRPVKHAFDAGIKAQMGIDY